MALKRHHKIMIGGVSSLIIAVLIANSVLVYFLFLKIDLVQQDLTNQIDSFEADTQTKINELSTNLIQTQTKVDTSINSLSSQIEQVKLSASSDFSEIIEDSINSVVTIRTDVAQGTGFIINDEGYIVTNAHVLSGGHRVVAITSEKQTITAEFIGYDADFDLALLKIPGSYNSLSLGDSDEIQIGEKVIAIGNPLGLQFSVSEGIVSAVDRQGLNELEAYIQTDAALNPGNSGGPLINKNGEVIGINNFKISGGENIGFALESDYIKQIVNEIAEEKLDKILI